MAVMIRAMMKEGGPRRKALERVGWKPLATGAGGKAPFDIWEPYRSLPAHLLRIIS